MTIDAKAFANLIFPYNDVISRGTIVAMITIGKDIACYCETLYKIQ